MCTSTEENTGSCSVYVWNAALPGFLGSEYDFDIAVRTCGSSRFHIFKLCKEEYVREFVYEWVHVYVYEYMRYYTILRNFRAERNTSQNDRTERSIKHHPHHVTSHHIHYCKYRTYLVSIPPDTNSIPKGWMSTVHTYPHISVRVHYW